MGAMAALVPSSRKSAVALATIPALLVALVCFHIYSFLLMLTGHNSWLVSNLLQLVH